MKHERKFIIKLYNNEESYTDLYITKIYQTFIGHYYIKTDKIKNAKRWKYKKSCENIIEKIQNDLNPTKKYLRKYKLKIEEITDNKILRKIKLKNLQK